MSFDSTLNKDEIKKLYILHTVELPGTSTIRATNLDKFTEAVSAMMEKAFYSGKAEAYKEATQALDVAFNKP